MPGAVRILLACVACASGAVAFSWSPMSIAPMRRACISKSYQVSTRVGGGLPTTSMLEGGKGESEGKKMSLKEIGESSGSMRVSRSQISPAELLQMQREAALADPEVASQRRRNVALAIMSPLIGAGLFGAKASSTPVEKDPIAMLKQMEKMSPSLEVAMKNGRPTVIEFYATWCKDCKAMAPQMTDFEKKFSKQINFVVLDAEKEENAALVNLFRVDAIPHFAMVDTDTKLLTTLTGFFPPKIFQREFEALAAGIQLPYCGPDRCYLDESSGAKFKQGDRDS